MNKVFAMVLCIALALSLAACANTESKIDKESPFDVSMEVVDGTVTPMKATVLIKNNTDIEIDSGNEYDFSIEVLKNGKWKTINVGNRDNNADALVFLGESELVIDWSNIYGELPSGDYRIVKSFFPWTEDGTYGINDEFYLTAEFSIK